MKQQNKKSKPYKKIVAELSNKESRTIEKYEIIQEDKESLVLELRGRGQFMGCLSIREIFDFVKKRDLKNGT